MSLPGALAVLLLAAQAGAEQEPRLEEQVRTVSLPLQAQQGVELPSGLVLPTQGGTLRIDFNPAPSRASEPPPPAPRDPRPVIAAGVALLASILLWLQRPRDAAPAAPPAPPPPGVGISANFAIVRTLGEGGMGVVYEAIDRALDRRVAVKRMRAGIAETPEALERFLKEARTVAALRHPNIVEIHSVAAQAGEILLVFEFVAGRTLHAALRELRTFRLAEAKAVLAPVCAALEFAHARKVVHRDLKPANVMIAADGTVKVMDFGIAREVRSAAAPGGSPAPGTDGADRTRGVAGTPAYMAPEAAYGLVCPQSDVWALGIMLYELLTGRVPFPAGAPGDPRDAKSYPLAGALVPGLPPAVDGLIASALEPDFRSRLPAAAEFGARLAAL